ncbi:MAG: FAD-binding oxidoreductase [Gemmatimonadaceae bacterium]
MTQRATVAIIGGGAIGASIAWHLASSGVDNIVVIDQAAGPGQGSTGKATGGYRAQFGTAVNVQLSLLSRSKLLEFERMTGIDPGYQQVGYLWLASTDMQLAALRSARSVQHAEGLAEARDVSPEEIAALNPLVDTNGIVGGAFCPTDGYIRPLEILRGYQTAAERLGVRFVWRNQCTRLDLDDSGRVTRVTTPFESYAIDSVVNAAGAWAAGIADLAGVDLPVTPLKRQAAFTVPCPAIPPDMPMTIFMGSGFHIRARDGRALLSWPGPEVHGEPDELSADPAWIDTVSAMARRYVPMLSDVQIDTGLAYAGLYEISPDHHAILGVFPEIPNLYFANGSSGHGVMHSPAIGDVIASMITGREPPVDVTILRPSRFREGQAVTGPELL